MDVPKVQWILLESRSGVGPFGAKGIGEPAMTPVAPVTRMTVLLLSTMTHSPPGFMSPGAMIQEKVILLG